MSKFNTVLVLFAALSIVSCGDDSSSSASNGSSNSFKKIYLASAMISSGDQGLADFDQFCSAGYQALAGDTTRHPDVGSGAANWILQANTEYRRADGVTVIGTTTNNGVFSFPLTNSFGTATGSYFTGLQTDWSVLLTQNCGDWGSMADDRTYGDALSKTSTAIVNGVQNCNNSLPNLYVVCVEQ